jgi:predicted transglutaminase-like cysteine proteinase
MRESGAIEGAASGFKVGDNVIVMKKSDDSSIKVIGHIGGIRRCVKSDNGDYYIFYKDSDTLKIANATYNSDIEVIDTRTWEQVFTSNFGGDESGFRYPLTWFLKKFRHKVDGTYQDLYLIITNLYINPNPYAGWTAFATANPAHALVTNTSNTQITLTDQVLTDLNAVNLQVNTDHPYIPEYGASDNWKILTGTQGGDCEDLALTKAQALLELGYPASALHIECGLSKDLVRDDGYPKGHAWLVVQTTLADYALDLSHNTVVVNSALCWPGTSDDFIGRRRQIGSKWAFISSYGWMVSSILSIYPSDAYTFFYVLDPTLNIVHYLGGISDSNFPWFAGGTPYMGVENNVLHVPSYYGTFYQTVNFSSDDIYIFSVLNPTKTLSTYRLVNNSIVKTAETTGLPWGFVKSDGTVLAVTDVDHGPLVVSQDGYFDVSLTDIGFTSQMHHMQSFSYTWAPTEENPDASTFTMPDSSTIHSDELQKANFWQLIEADESVLQGVIIFCEGVASYYMYKDGVSCLEDIKSAVSTTDDRLLGMVYIPSTDRLNRT